MTRARRPYGAGGLYRPTYRRRDGTTCHQDVWWLAYRAGGRLVRESSETTVKTEAERLLRKRLEAAAAGRLGPDAHKTTLATLEKILADNYAANGRDETPTRFKRLAQFFGRETPARSITADRITAFQRQRKAEGAKPATINREVSALRHAFRLAARSGRVESVPYFGMLQERNTRAGFFERDAFEAVRAKLPDWLQAVVTFMYWTGWRTREVLTLQWRAVDLKEGVVRLEPGSTKNREGRTLPYRALPELSEMFRAQRALTTKLERERDAIIPYVFHRNGASLVDVGSHPQGFVYDAWRAACLAAGVPGRILHDFRRTAVRNLERAGISRSVAMKITGHKTESVFRRYAIVSEGDLAEALGKVARKAHSSTSG